MLRLDYVSCVLTIASTILVGRRCWEGWALAALNSVIVCFIGLKTDQLGFIPANVFCMVMSGVNLRAWLKLGSHPPALVRSPLSRSAVAAAGAFTIIAWPQFQSTVRVCAEGMAPAWRCTNPARSLCALTY